MRFAKRRDKNDLEITAALKKAGFGVLDLASASLVPDKLVFKGGWVCFVEIKTKNGRLTSSQNRFQEIMEPRGEFFVARDAEEAVTELTARFLASRPPKSPTPIAAGGSPPAGRTGAAATKTPAAG